MANNSYKYFNNQAGSSALEFKDFQEAQSLPKFKEFSLFNNPKPTAPSSLRIN